MALTARQRDRERSKARAAFRELSPRDRSELQDQLVLDDFDWRDWFHAKPSSVLLNHLSDLIAEWEQSQ